MTNIDRVAEILAGYPPPHLSYQEHDDECYEIIRAFLAEGLLMPDLPEPEIDSDGWATWESECVVTEAGYHPEKGLWTYDDGRMVQDSAERLREVACIYLAAANHAERNQK
ncbi:hypothetical protein [Corynebacterium variabile]|uniref:hypothetical protein n=1 Tax=Corynebacterium variabile TaxID=1727 RepID=UPI002FE2561A